VIRSRFAKGP